MGECLFRIFRKLLCATLILSLLWPDVAKCMDEENSPQQPSFIPSHLKEEIFDQKEDLPFTKESKLPTILKEEKTSSEDLRHEDNPENNLEKLHVSEEITNKEEGSSENKIPPEDTNTSSQELKKKEEKKEDNKNTETLSPQTTSLPKENESNKEIKKEENNLLQESIEIFEEGEEGGFGEKTIEEEEGNDLKVPLPIEEDEELSEKTKPFLSYFKKRIIDGWPNWKQVVGAGVGTAIGAGVGLGMMVIIYGDCVGAAIGLPIPYLFNIIDISLSTGIIFLIPITSGFDAIMRASSSLMSIFGDAGQDFFLLDTKSYKKRLRAIQFLLYTTSFISSSLPIYYLYYSTKILWAGGFTTNFAIMLFSLLAMPQIFDTIFSYGKSLSDQAGKEVKKKALQKRLKTLFFGSKEEKIETQRQFYVETLKKLMWILYKLPDEQIKQLYEEVFPKIEKGEVSEALNTLKVLEVLLKVYESYEGEDPIPSQQAKKKQASIFGWIGAGLASVGRHLAFWYSIYSINSASFLSLLPLLPSEVMWPLSILLGGIIGATTQGWIERENLEKSYFNITRGKTVTEPQGWWPIRVINRVWNYLIQGPFYSLPYLFTLIEFLVHCNTKEICHYVVPLPLIIIMGVPFLLADAANNATYFNESSGKWISAINRLLSYTPFAKYLTGYKKDKLIEITHGFREKMRDLIPEVVKDLDTYFRKKIPNLFPSQTNEEDSEKEERESFLKDRTREKNDGFTLLNDMTSDGENTNEQEIIFTRSMELSRQKRTWFGYCLQGLGKCCKGIGSLFTCCSKRSKRKDPFKDMGFLKIEEEVIN
ncbi:MAG: hypothetical protein KBD90_05325 [Alphaproteobacteria bacterium]|nr:hypothetical protein [Alphaproteobacteria bacterium]